MTVKNFCTGVQHIGIPTKDMQASLSFYQALGFEVVHSNIVPGSNDHVNFLKLENLVMEVYESQDAVGAYGAIEHVAIDVTDIESVYQIVCEKGLNTLNDQINYLPFWSNGVKYFTIEGPNKEKVEFSQFL